MPKSFIKFLSVFAAALIFLANASPSSINAEAEMFKITPSNYSITITRLSPVDLPYKFQNQISTDLKFNIHIPEEAKAELKQAGIIVALVEGDKETVLNSTDTVMVSVPANTVEDILIRLTPSKSERFKLNFVLEFEQVEAEQKLTTSKYNLSIDLESKLAAQLQTSQLEILILGVVLTLAVVISVVLLVLRIIRKRNGK